MIEITIPEYITHVQLSKRRKAKHYKRGDKMPLKYQDRKKYKFDREGYLVSAKGGLRVIANPRSAGTPKFLKINGQAIYSGNMRPMVRAKVVNAMKEFFSEKIKDMQVLKWPYRIEADLYAPIAASNWDLDNQWIYHKCFIDALVAEGKLFDDNIMYVTESPGFRYFPVETPEERKLVYRLIPEDRKEILEHPSYQKVHAESIESLAF